MPRASGLGHTEGGGRPVERRPATLGARGRIILAIGALFALGLAAAAQWMLEGVRLTAHPAPALAIVLFVIAALCAVSSTWKCDTFEPGMTELRVVIPGARWLAAMIPGIGCLVMAAVLHAGPTHHPSSPLTLILWAGGIALLLAAGLAHRLFGVRPTTVTAGEDWSRGRLLLCGVGLVVVSLVLRTVVGVAEYPYSIENDEAYIGLVARDILGGRPYAFFDLFWVGVPNLSLAFTRAAQLVFDESLWGIRMGNAVLGALSIPCVFGFGRRLIGNFPALMAAMLVATAHVHVHWSRNGQHFILTAVGAAVVLWLFARAWTGGSLLSWIGTGVPFRGAGSTVRPSMSLLPVSPINTAANVFGSTR